MVFIFDFVLLNLDEQSKFIYDYKNSIKKEPNLILNSTLNLSKVKIR